MVGAAMTGGIVQLQPRASHRHHSRRLQREGHSSVSISLMILCLWDLFQSSLHFHFPQIYTVIPNRYWSSLLIVATSGKDLESASSPSTEDSRNPGTQMEPDQNSPLKS